MGLKRLVLGVGAFGVSMMTLASCTGLGSIETKYVDAKGTTQEVIIEKTTDSKKVLSALKALTKADVAKINATSMKTRIKFDMSGKVMNYTYKSTMDIDGLLDYSTSSPNFYMKNNMYVEASGQKQNINMEMTLVGDYGYLYTNADGYTTKVKLPKDDSNLSDLVSEMEKSKEQFDDSLNRGYSELFKLFNADYTAYDSSYEFLEDNEDKILDFIDRNHVEISGVTSTIYFKMNLSGNDMVNAWNMGGGSSYALASSVSSTDSLSFIIGYSSSDFTLNYFEIDATNAPSLLSSVLDESTMSIDRLVVTSYYEYGNDKVSEPSDASSYSSYSLF